MHINRKLLYDMTEAAILKMADKESDIKGKTWREKIDIDFILYMIKEVIMLDPTVDCRVGGSMEDWEGLPHSKSLFYSPEGCGLPIGNLTSQLFSNVYLNGLDQFVKRTLKCKHYGRYVDDFYIVSESREYLHSIIPLLSEYIEKELHLEINPAKTKIYESTKGVDFLGGFVKPRRIYISNQSLRRMKGQMVKLGGLGQDDAFASINSFLGTLSHFKTFNIRKHLVGIGLIPDCSSFAALDDNLTKLKRPRMSL